MQEETRKKKPHKKKVFRVRNERMEMVLWECVDVRLGVCELCVVVIADH